MTWDNLPPIHHPSPNAGESIDWDKPAGYGHASNILHLLNRPERTLT